MPNRAFALSEQIRKLLSQALYFEMNDPEFSGVTITRVRVSPDLQFADIRFSCSDEQRNIKKVLASFERARGAFKRILARQVKLRRVPELRFHVDEDVSAERRIHEILDQLHVPEPENDDT